MLFSVAVKSLMLRPSVTLISVCLPLRPIIISMLPLCTITGAIRFRGPETVIIRGRVREVSLLR